MGFFSILLIAVAVLVASFIAMFVYRAAKSWIDLNFYRQQGIKTYYHPILGYYGMLLKKPNPGQRRCEEGAVEFVKNSYDRGVVVSNRFGGHSPNVIITSADYLKEFLMKEDLFERKFSIPDFPMNFGFMFKSGPQAMHERSIFQEIVLYDELKHFAPLISKVAIQFYDQFARDKSVNSENFTKINLDEIMPLIMDKVAQVILFGRCDFSDDSIEVSIQRDADSLVHMGAGLISNVFLGMAPGFFYTFPFFIKKLDELFKKKANLMIKIDKYLKSREGENPAGASTFDKIIAHNHKCLTTGNKNDFMTVDAITGTLCLISFASQDTSQNLSKGGIYLLAENPLVKEEMYRISKEVYDSKGKFSLDKIESHVQLSMFFKETIRLANPAFGLLNRVATTNVTIKDVKIKKGHSISLLFGSLNMDPKYFDKPNEFHFDRFSKENEKNYPRYQSIPFGVGKRVCIGRHLGELTVKILMTSFCNKFDFDKPADTEYYDMFKFVRTQKNPFVNAKLKAK